MSSMRPWTASASSTTRSGACHSYSRCSRGRSSRGHGKVASLVPRGLVGVALVGAALTFVVLVVFRVLSWERQHPLLKQMYKLKHLRLRDKDTDYEFLALGQAIVRTYLPPNESEPLLLRLDAAEERVKSVLGMDGRGAITRRSRQIIKEPGPSAVDARRLLDAEHLADEHGMARRRQARERRGTSRRRSPPRGRAGKGCRIDRRGGSAAVRRESYHDVARSGRSARRLAGRDIHGPEGAAVAPRSKPTVPPVNPSGVPCTGHGRLVHRRCASGYGCHGRAGSAQEQANTVTEARRAARTTLRPYKEPAARDPLAPGDLDRERSRAPMTRPAVPLTGSVRLGLVAFVGRSAVLRVLPLPPGRRWG